MKFEYITKVPYCQAQGIGKMCQMVASPPPPQKKGPDWGISVGSCDKHLA